MNFCPFCGRKIEDSDTFCGFCGKPVEGPPRVFAPIPQTVPQPQVQQPQPQQQPPKRKPVGLIIGISAGVAVLLIGAILAVVLAVMNKKTDTTDDYEETTVSSSETAETTVPSPTPVPTTTTSTTTETTPTSSDTPTPTPRPQVLRKVKVSDAYNKTYKGAEDDKINDRVPKITIEGIDTSAINQDIYNTCKKRFKNFGMSYSYYVGEKYISVIIFIYGYHYDEMHEIFNISRVSGKKLTRNQMLSLLGISSKDFESKVKKQIKNEWEPAIKEGITKSKDGKALYNKAIGSNTLKRAIPCVNSKGKVCCYISKLPYFGGSDYMDFFKPI